MLGSQRIGVVGVVNNRDTVLAVGDFGAVRSNREMGEAGEAEMDEQAGEEQEESEGEGEEERTKRRRWRWTRRHRQP